MYVHVCVCMFLYVCIDMALANPASVALWACSITWVGQNHTYTVYVRRVGQNRINTPCMTVYLVVSLPNLTVYALCIYGSGQPYIYGVYYIRCKLIRYFAEKSP